MTDYEALAVTLWGEARGEPIESQIGVAMVIRNRVLTHYGGAQTYVDVCLAHAQFSAWTQEVQQMQAETEMLQGDPTLAHHPDCALRRCAEIATATINGLLTDNTHGSNHYYATTIAPPSWAPTQALATLGHHRFFSVA